MAILGDPEESSCRGPAFLPKKKLLIKEAWKFLRFFLKFAPSLHEGTGHR